MPLFITLIIGLVLSTVHGDDCIPRKFDENSIVCVCNSTYCDSVEIEVPVKGAFRIYTSSQSGQRLESQDGNFENCIDDRGALRLDPTTKYQTICGFGGAFTDAAGLNILSLSVPTQQQLIQTYFGRNGNRYNLGRVPIGGSDFSTRPYTLDDIPGDTTLANFSLAPEDISYKIPYMKKALDLNPDLRFIAGSWTAPPWMKTDNQYVGLFGELKTEYYQTYADYLIKFLETYKQSELPMWAMSTGNEPIDGFFQFVQINSMAWTPQQQATWLVNNLAPALAQSTAGDIKILALDDERYQLPWWIDMMYETEEVDRYLAGIAIHWYSDSLAPSSLLDKTHTKYPDKFIINTEASVTPLPWDTKPVRLGSWRRAELYIRDIIEDLNHWVCGWVDWNLALDKDGGPNWVHNPVDSPIIVNPETDEFFKQPLFYSMAHFSKFLPLGSTRIDLTPSRAIKSVAFLTPNNEVVVVLHNPTYRSKVITINDPDLGAMQIEMPPKSVQTVIYQR
ncbi:glucosylceramidase [Fopius arisanus]|uniref:Glucosylceramidase n=1 Tax=Fopius arisanus TaxID=64838 RepID=A0A0C9QXG4_9HYME|nr:PREDICTED: glucosylceramidase-like [Fopius arisanus]XP_011305243.1 PREDICTED: glucosylceramidase-like [Fopius arisanus]